ncbi:MAG: Pimeloyl-[acyl-carrier protein] methyl ester esterase [Pseudomonadota bacterium]
MSKPVLAYLTGWGVRGDLLGHWLECFSDRFELCPINVPDLETQRLLTPVERSELLAQQVSAPALWIGWSLGGEFVIDLATHQPDAVKGMVLLASNPLFVEQADWPGMSEETFNQFVESYQQNSAKTLQRFASLQVAGSPEPRALLRTVKESLEEPAELLGGLLTELARDRRPEFAALSKPHLMLFAEWDSLVPCEVSSLCSGTLIADSSHLLFVDQPDQCQAAVENWLTTEALF